MNTTVPSTQPLPAASLAPTLASAASVPQQITPYQPAHLRNSTMMDTSTGHPVRGAPSQSILNWNPAQPQYQGIQSLGTGVTRQIVNQQRLASASATIPRQPALQARTARRGRPRGSTNNHPPGLSASAPTMENAVVTHDDGSRTLKIRVKVYPPPEVCISFSLINQPLLTCTRSLIQSWFYIQTMPTLSMPLWSHIS